MKATITLVPWSGERTLVVTFEPGDFLIAHLDALDMLLLEECSKSQSVADWLLAAETLARRIEQAKAKTS